MNQVPPIFTLHDAREERLLAELNREHHLAVKQARAKVRHWKRLAAKFNGEVHHETLARMRANLADLLNAAEAAPVDAGAEA